METKLLLCLFVCIIVKKNVKLWAAEIRYLEICTFNVYRSKPKPPLTREFYFKFKPIDVKHDLT